MKILNIGDLHLGVRKDDEWIQNIQRHSFKQMIDYSVQHKIDTWIQYGDVFDVRAHTTQRCMEFTRELFDMVEDAGITVHTILGNHDLFYKTKLYPNTTQELLSHRKNVIIYDKPTTVNFDGTEIDLIPWMLESNTTEIMNHVKETTADYCIGHWELNGFYFYKGLKSHGLEPDFLKQYKQVWSGHFHTISEAGNVKYIGTPFTITAGDENDPRGFWVFDTDTKAFDFVPNPVCWHRKIMYPNKTIKFEDFRNIDVRVIVETVDKELPKFESELEKVVHSLRIVSKVDNSVEGDEEADVDIKSLPELMEEYIDALPDSHNDEDRKALKALAKQLYIEVSRQ